MARTSCITCRRVSCFASFLFISTWEALLWHACAAQAIERCTGLAGLLMSRTLAGCHRAHDQWVIRTQLKLTKLDCRSLMTSPSPGWSCCTALLQLPTL